MPTRTYLTTPPGRSPSEATGRSASEAQERYVPGPAAPVEPTPPSRWRAPLLVLLSAAVVLAVLVIVLRVTAASQAQDPALDPSLDRSGAGDEGPTLRDGSGGDPDDGLPGEG